MPETVLFVCPHGVAKSVIARAYFQQLADRRRFPATSLAVGIDPDDAVWPEVVAALGADGLDVSDHEPREINARDLATATTIVTLGCELPAGALPATRVEAWNDLPLASQDLAGAQAAIRRRVERLVDSLRAAAGGREG